MSKQFKVMHELLKKKTATNMRIELLDSLSELPINL